MTVNRFKTIKKTDVGNFTRNFDGAGEALWFGFDLMIYELQES